MPDAKTVAELKVLRGSSDWQERYHALEEARDLPASSRVEVAELFVADENAWVRSLAKQLMAPPGTPARRSRRGIVREVDQVLHGAFLTFDQRSKLIRLFEEAEESGSTAQLGLAVDRASRLVTAALSEPGKTERYLRQLDAFLSHVAMYVRPVPVRKDTEPLNYVIERSLSAFSLRTSVTITSHLDVRADALERALKELAQNAIDAGADRVDIRGDVRNGNVVVELTNNGAELPPQHTQALFQPWFTTRAGHAGLGLYLARAAVSEVGGSTLLLSGSAPVVFEVTLPR